MDSTNGSNGRSLVSKFFGALADKLGIGLKSRQAGSVTRGYHQDYTMPQAPYIKALNFVLKWEGNYVNDPQDPGGETKFGISKRAYPDVDIASLTKEDAVEIYRRDYWTPIKGHLMASGLATAVFDYAVVSGPGRAIRSLQRALGVTIDGVFGPATEHALRNVNHEVVAAKVIDERLDFLMVLNASPSRRRFIKGWLRRLIDLTREVAKN
jgi:lysozyme family protein